jgi:hypothetical protein
MKTVSSQKIIAKRRETLTPGAFKRRYSQELYKDPVMMKRIESINAERQAKRKKTIYRNNPALSDITLTVKEIDEEDPEKSQSVECDLSADANED